MTVVLDTNILLVAVARNSALHLIFQKLIQAQFKLAVSTEILLEYEEILGRKLGEDAAKNVLFLLVNLPNLIRVETHFFWGLITKDPDDNKFIDCAIAANAKYIVSDDKHFKILNEIDFPPLTLLSGEKFVEELKSV